MFGGFSHVSSSDNRDSRSSSKAAEKVVAVTSRGSDVCLMIVTMVERAAMSCSMMDLFISEGVQSRKRVTDCCATRQYSTQILTSDTSSLTIHLFIYYVERAAQILLCALHILEFIDNDDAGYCYCSFNKPLRGNPWLC